MPERSLSNHDHEPADSGRGGPPVAVVVVIVILVIVFVVLHLTGVVGPQAHSG